MKRTLPFLRHRMRIPGSRRNALDVARGRVVFMKICFAVFFMIIAARVMDLVMIQGELSRHMDGPGAARIADDIVQERLRADITDRNGVLLATSLEMASLYADPSLIEDKQKVAADLVKILPGASYGDLLQKMQRGGKFIWLHRNMTPDEQFAVLKLGHPGLNFRTEYRRIYPQGVLAPHMVGFTNIDGDGLMGVERSFNELLKEGARPLRLTLDMRLQHVLRRETAAAMKEFKGIGAAGAIVDVTNGEVLAAVSLPDFDPHNPGDPNGAAHFNRLTQGVYELGSTFKIFSTAAAIEYLKLGMNHKFDAREPLVRGSRRIKDFHAENRILTLPEVFMHSSNIGSALMAEMVGTQKLKDFYADLGLLRTMSFEIGEVGKPIVPDPWRDINALTASYGHGIAVAPLQMVMAASTVVGDGTLLRPTLVMGEGAKSDTQLRVVSNETAHRMRQLMRLVVASGTARYAEVPGYSVGGKTGTAIKIANGRYQDHLRLSNFIGFFPMNAPRYAVFVMVDEPKGTARTHGYATGGWVAAPAVGRVISAMAPILGIPPQHIAPEQEMSAALRAYLHDKDQNKGGTLVSY